MTIKKKITVPIYYACVLIIITDDMPSERRKLDNIFGESPRDDYVSLCCYSGAGHFALIFTPQFATSCIISHEIFHLTHKILEWSNQSEFKESNHEQGAKLCEYLTEQVYKTLKLKTVKYD